MRDYIWNGLDLVGIYEGNELFYVRTDHIARPVFATNASGTVVWEASYLPFGGVQSATGGPDLRFPGQWFQSESGLHQNWMRDYDPTLGRYLQADPLGLIDGASVYSYVKQNPGRYVDPRGERGRPFQQSPAARLQQELLRLQNKNNVVPLPNDMRTWEPWVPTNQAIAELQDNFCRRCGPCRSSLTGQIVPLETLGYRYQLDSRGHFPYNDGEHVHLYRAKQNQATCICFWANLKPKRLRTIDPPPPVGALNIELHNLTSR